MNISPSFNKLTLTFVDDFPSTAHPHTYFFPQNTHLLVNVLVSGEEPLLVRRILIKTPLGKPQRLLVKLLLLLLNNKTTDLSVASSSRRNLCLKIAQLRSKLDHLIQYDSRPKLKQIAFKAFRTEKRPSSYKGWNQTFPRFSQQFSFYNEIVPGNSRSQTLPLSGHGTRPTSSKSSRSYNKLQRVISSPRGQTRVNMEV